MVCSPVCRVLCVNILLDAQNKMVNVICGTLQVISFSGLYMRSIDLCGLCTPCSVPTMPRLTEGWIKDSLNQTHAYTRRERERERERERDTYRERERERERESTIANVWCPSLIKHMLCSGPLWCITNILWCITYSDASHTLMQML